MIRQRTWIICINQLQVRLQKIWKHTIKKIGIKWKSQKYPKSPNHKNNSPLRCNSLYLAWLFWRYFQFHLNQGAIHCNPPLSTWIRLHVRIKTYSQTLAKPHHNLNSFRFPLSNSADSKLSKTSFWDLKLSYSPQKCNTLISGKFIMLIPHIFH